MLRIGLIGAGFMGGTHSLMLQQIAAVRPGDVDLAALAEPDEIRRESFRRQYGWRHGHADWRAMLERREVDAVFVCVPTCDHAAIVHAAAAAGVHVFCEKPLAMSSAEGREMLEAVDRAGICAQVGLVLRYSPVYTVMRDMLAHSGVEELMAVWLRDDQCFPIHGVHDTVWRSDARMSPGGTLIEHGVHDLDLIAWMFGPLRRLRAWQRSHAGYPGIEDYMAVEIELVSGVRVQLLNLWHEMEARPSNRRLEVFCRNTWLASDHDMLGTIHVQAGNQPERELEENEVLEHFERLLGRPDATFREWYGIPYLLEDLAFLEAVQTGRPAPVGMELGLQAQRLAELVYEAARSGEEVEVASVPSPSRRGSG